jgi:putative ATPase
VGLFDRHEAEHLESAKPLAARMRPRTLDEFVGQRHFLGEGKLLRRMLAADRLSSVVFYGPPGTGKTTLAEIIAHHTRREFAALNAAASGVKELRAVLDGARDRLAADGTRTVLFIDELHRFNRTQQDGRAVAGRGSRHRFARRGDDRQSVFLARIALGKPQPDL